jgi:oxygen-independent coproporphyrinogen-3 oxidase
MPAADITMILDKIRQYWQVDNNAEITLEANPDDLHEEALGAWKSIGINRLSIGIQSLYDDELAWMHRAHNAKEALNALEKAIKAGFRQLTADFIYGGELMSDERWQATLEWIASQKIPHISCYALTVEPKTPLAKRKRSTQELEAENEKQSRQFMMLMDAAAKSGYEHYEISNFALPGQRSRHNSAYWQGVAYMGIGPSAHSFDGDMREWNVSNNSKYIQSIQQGIVPSEKEALSKMQQLNEYLLTNLRRVEGCSINYITEKFGNEYAAELTPKILMYEEKGWMQRAGHDFQLTNKGKLFADAIALDLFFTENEKS